MNGTPRIQVVMLLGVFLLGTAGCGDDALNALHNPDGDKTDEPPCSTSLDCPPGQECLDGVCVPIDDPPPDDPPPDDPPPDPTTPLWVAGQWSTTYHLDWSDYLGPLAGLGSEIDVLDQLLMGNSDIFNLPIAGPILEALIDAYIPDWVGELVHILNGLVHFFTDVRIDGTMSLQHVLGSPRDLNGNEVWSRGVVQVIDQCPLGEADPSYPACAEVAVPLGQMITSFGVIGTEAEPFTGTLTGDEILFANREVQMEISQFVVYILDLVTRIATNNEYQTFNAVLASLVDCAGFTAAVEDLMCSAFGSCSPMPYIETACLGVVDDLIAQLTNALLSISIGWEVMQFDQRAMAIDNDGDGNADKLGNPPSAPGTIENGDFQVLYGSDLQGTWSATRP